MPGNSRWDLIRALKGYRNAGFGSEWDTLMFTVTQVVKQQWTTSQDD